MKWLKQWFEVIVLKMTHRLWNRQISRIIGRAYGDRIINSKQMHELAAAFDPTQRHIVYGERVPYGFKGANGVIRSAFCQQTGVIADELIRRLKEEKPEDLS